MELVQIFNSLGKIQCEVLTKAGQESSALLLEILNMTPEQFLGARGKMVRCNIFTKEL